jgi:hypothetical protein
VLLFLDVNQFSIITELLGTPPDDVIETICSENVLQLLFNGITSLDIFYYPDFALCSKPTEEGARTLQSEASHDGSRWSVTISNSVLLLTSTYTSNSTRPSGKDARI